MHLRSSVVRVQLRRTSQICGRVPIDELAEFVETASSSLGDDLTVRAVLSDNFSFEETVESLAGLRDAGPFDRPLKRPRGESKYVGALRCDLRAVGARGSVQVDVGAQARWRRAITTITIRHSDPHTAELLLRAAQALLRRHRAYLVYLGLINAALWGLLMLSWAISPPPASAFDWFPVDAEGNPKGSPTGWITVGVVTLSFFWMIDVILTPRWTSTITIPAALSASHRPARWNPSAESVKRWAVIGGPVAVLALLVGAASLYVQLTGIKFS